MIVKGDMKVSVHDVYGWDRVAEAHREMEANKNSGKVSWLAVRARRSQRLIISSAPDCFGNQVDDTIVPPSR